VVDGDRVLVDVVVTVTGGSVEVTVAVEVAVDVVVGLGTEMVTAKYPPMTIITITTTATANRAVREIAFLEENPIRIFKN
jgi:hypothetical protein